MTYTFKLSSRLAMLWAPACAVAFATAACTDGDMSSMSPFDQLGNGGTASAAITAVSPKSAVIEISRPVQFSSGSGVSWTSTGGKISRDGTFSSSVTGSFLVLGHGKNRVDSARVTVVNPNQPRRLTISPREVQLTAGQSAVFGVAATLPNGTPTSVDVKWDATSGTVDRTGSFVAGAVPGTYSVIVSAADLRVADTAVVTVTPGARQIVRMVLAPATAVVVAGGVQRYSASAEYSDGTSGPAMASFSASGGSINADGDFTAGNTPGTFQVVATAQDRSTKAVASVSVTPQPSSITSPTTPSAVPSNGVVLFSDDFSSGDFSKTSGGWAWNRHEKVDVVRGFSKDGNTGSAARYTFEGNIAPELGPWAELRFTIGTPTLQELWITYYLYMPSGTESVSRGPRFLHRTGPAGTEAQSNDKFFRLFHTYEPGYLKYGADTWASANPGDGNLRPFVQIRTNPDGQHFWDIAQPEEINATRGRWQKIEIHCKVASAPTVANGVLQIFRDGVPLVDMTNLDSYPTMGENFFRQGYLLGWSASGFANTTYEYISNVTFSTQRLP